MIGGLAIVFICLMAVAGCRAIAKFQSHVQLFDVSCCTVVRCSDVGLFVCRSLYAGGKDTDWGPRQRTFAFTVWGICSCASLFAACCSHNSLIGLGDGKTCDDDDGDDDNQVRFSTMLTLPPNGKDKSKSNEASSMQHIRRLTHNLATAASGHALWHPP